MKYGKLVRDRIIYLIEKNDEVPVAHFADDREYLEKLREKCNEEIDEFLGEVAKLHEAKDKKAVARARDKCAEELADVLEVVYAFAGFVKISRATLEKKREEKERTRGGFQSRFILDETIPAAEVVRKANEIVSPYGLKAELLSGCFSVGVGGDHRTYTPVICLTGPFPGYDVYAKVSTEISNRLPINRVTFRTA